MNAKCAATDIKKVCADQDHLTKDQQQKLQALLERYEDLFDGTLGKWNEEPVQLELKEGAEPYHARPFPVPRCHADTLKMEVERLVKIGVLKKVNRSEWAAPSFIIQKKDGTARFINDFRELNKRIRRKPFPIPNTQDMLMNLEGFQWATSLDLNMGYYHVELSPSSKKLCTLVFPTSPQSDALRRCQSSQSQRLSLTSVPAVADITSILSELAEAILQSLSKTLWL